MRDRKTGDDYERPYVAVNGNGDGRYAIRWLLTLFCGLILAGFAADISWQVNEAAEVSALKTNQAAMNAKLDFLVDLAKRTRGM